jgi:DNA-binding LacI/PurR family transcriptional regulator
MSTISDVAKAAGVSVATVSRALRGLDRVNPDTRAKVLEVAEQLQYVASPSAASLATGRTQVVGVVAPFLTRWFFATLVSGIEKSLRDHGHHVLLFDLEAETFDRRLRVTQGMLWKRVDGLIVLNVPMDDDERALVERLELPVVTIGNRVGGWPCVRIDDTAAMLLAARHIIDLGHSDIAYVGVVPSTADHLLTPLERRTAFLASLERAGLTCPREWLVASDWTASGAAADVVPVLTAAHRPTAVVAASDEMAIGVMCAARRLGMDVPADLSVVGIDDHTFADVMDLTTVRQNVAEQGRQAGEILIGEILGSPISPPDETVLPVELVVRGSTAPPRRT